MNDLVLTHEVELATLAGEINTMHEQANDLADKALVLAARTGEKLSKAKSYATGNFEDWLAKACPRLKRTQAYNYMALAKKMPELLVEGVHTSGHLLSTSQAIALLSADEDTKQLVMDKIDQGESVTVAEINELKRENKRLQSDMKKAMDANADLDKRNNELEELLESGNEQQIDSLVEKAVEQEKAKLQQDLDKLVAEHGKDYQQQIDHLNDRLMQAKNELAKAKSPETLDRLNKEIVSAEEHLEQLMQKKRQVATDTAYNNLATYLIEQSAGFSATLVELSARSGELTPPTVALLLRAAHDFKGIAVLLSNATQYEQLELEDFSHVELR